MKFNVIVVLFVLVMISAPEFAPKRMYAFQGGLAHGGMGTGEDVDSPKLAVVNFIQIFELLVDSKQFDDEVNEIEGRMKAENEEFMKQMQPLVDEGRKLDRNSPEYRALKQRADELQKAYDERMQRLRGERNLATQRRGIRAATDAQAAVEVVAARLKIDFVLQTSSIPNLEEKHQDSVVPLRYLARGALIYPKDSDITFQVEEELGLKGN